MSQIEEKEEKSLHFIEQIILDDLADGKNKGRLQTRFPPEPNGYLHIGHAKAIVVNFGLAAQYGGDCNLRFDDTNPVTEDTLFVDKIREDVSWLGYQWAKECYASDYFETLYAFAHDLIDKGLAYVDDSSSEEIGEMKGNPVTPGKNSPFRERPIAENKALFTAMKDGSFKDGEKVLRAKIDMSSPNMHFRDPIIYRIKHAHHHRTADKWCIYPMYDFAHGQSDAIENVTHSLCSLEFRHHRDLYDWFIQQLGIFPSRQIEFARMNVAYMITSKRKLVRLIQENLVSGWDDPRMSTISGMRRRGYPAKAIVAFCDRAGVAKRDNLISIELLEFSVREVLNKTALRAMAVLDPVKVTLSNFPENQVDWLPMENNPEDPEGGTRLVPFSNHLYIERDDFSENPPPKYFRLAPGQLVRLKGAYIIKCDDVIKNKETGEVIEIVCSYFPESKSGQDTSGLKVKGTLHWVEASHAVTAEIRDYERLFTVPEPTAEEDIDFLHFVNTESLKINTSAKVEPSLLNANSGQTYQFLRQGYYCKDKDSTGDVPVFNRTVGLKDSFVTK
ncbi:MAG: glutamine--tRNA ligase/YqeY domain fusion protein [Saprospiraceae bacterium]|jgi:glutaminyl-tRNA synthetase|nr:glutamine--tRNA ligase/YqeY domain fusion protein [Saprospiraceae bacterium]